jgi:Fe-S cluster assembly protein SufD
MSPGLRHFEEQLEALQALPGTAVRASAYARFQHLGLPTPRHEEWRYTNLASLTQMAFSGAVQGALPTPEALEARLGPAFGHRMVFLNGRYDASLSTVGKLPPGVKVLSLLAAREQKLEGALGLPSDDGRALTALNSALGVDGAYLFLPRGTVVPEPIEWVFVSSADVPFATHPRNVVLASENSEATILESFVSLGGPAYFTNALTWLQLAQGAHVRHYRLQSEGAEALHLGLLQASLEKDSHLLSHAVQVGGKLARHEVRVTLAAEGARTTLQGLYLGKGKQLLDNHTVVDHARPHGVSQEVFKGILDDDSRGVFNGKVIVRENAIQTDSSQVNQNLLLSEGAQADTRPQLEIFADDVKCKHGATVGRIDDKALFYLRSRGIPRALAQGILTYAFASEMVSLIEVEAHRQRVQALVKARLDEGHRLGAFS